MKLLVNKSVAYQFDWVKPCLPKLIFLDFGICPASECESVQKPRFPAFICFCDSCHDRFRSKLFQVPHNIRQRILARGRGDDMDMVGHKTPRENIEPFMVLAIPERINKDILIDTPCKNIEPVNYRESKEVNPVALYSIFKSHSCRSWE